MSGSELTYNERRIGQQCRFDLGAGYPIGLTPDWVWELSMRDRRGGLDHDLSEIVSVQLRADGCVVYPTFSGSVALQRSFLAARSYLLERFSDVEFLIPDPCIDIIVQMSNEFSTESTRRLKFAMGTIVSEMDCERLCLEIESRAKRGVGVVVALVSPDNPTGAIWRREESERVIAACDSCGGVLVVDHCFLLSGVHGVSTVEPVWSFVDSSAPVIAVWDTGKTVDLGGTKLGFILTKNSLLSKAVCDALSVIQYQLADHTVGWICDVLASPEFPSLVGNLRLTMRANQQKLQVLADQGGFFTFGVAAGAFELISGRNSSLKDVGTIDFATFSNQRLGGESHWQRVALARPQDYFETAISLLNLNKE